MATIEKRGDSYRITVSCGYDISGKQIRKHLTWAPSAGMTKKQEAKELERQKVIFEERCRSGQILDGTIRFQDFSEKWMDEYAKQHLRPKTVARYQDMLVRINAGIGHIKLDALQPHHLMAFYSNLAEAGIRKDGKCRYSGDFRALLAKNSITKTALAANSGVSTSVLNSLTQGKCISKTSADKIAAYFKVPTDKIFQDVTNGQGLSGKTILHHHRLISSILATAVKWQVIFANPCDRVQPPKVERKEAKYLDDTQASRLLDLLKNESVQNQTIISLLLYTGLRRGELCGLEWSDVDFETGVLTVRRSSLYLPERGVYTDETKTASSTRSIKVPDEVIKHLRQHRAWQSAQQLQLGDQWIRSSRIFTAQDGRPINPDTITSWFHRFIEKNDLPRISIHSLRHTNATLLIAAGTDLQTVAHRLGHANVITTGKIYAHAIEAADAVAADTIQDILHPTSNTK